MKYILLMVAPFFLQLLEVDPDVIMRVELGGSKSRSSSKKKGDALIVYLAIIVVVAALLGGYFTADAIMKRADAEYDAFAYAEQRRRQQRGYY